MSKATGSLVTNAFSDSLPGLVMFGGSVAAGGAAFLVWVAWLMGRRFDELIESGEIIGGEEEVREEVAGSVPSTEGDEVAIRSHSRKSKNSICQVESGGWVHPVVRAGESGEDAKLDCEGDAHQDDERVGGLAEIVGRGGRYVRAKQSFENHKKVWRYASCTQLYTAVGVVP